MFPIYSTAGLSTPSSSLEIHLLLFFPDPVLKLGRNPNYFSTGGRKIFSGGYDFFVFFFVQLSYVDPTKPASLTWQRNINSEGNVLKEFVLTPKEIFQLAPVGIQLRFLVREKAAKGRMKKANSKEKKPSSNTHEANEPYG